MTGRPHRVLEGVPRVRLQRVADDRQGETVVVECVFKGHYKGELMGIAPTNRNVPLPIAFVLDFREGKIRNRDSYFDVARVVKPIGAMG